MPMFPELDSMITLSERIAPERRPSLMILMAGRSFMLPPGLSASSLAYSRKGNGEKIFTSSIKGVLPMVDKIPSFMAASLLANDTHSDASPNAGRPVSGRHPRCRIGDGLVVAGVEAV